MHITLRLAPEINRNLVLSSDSLSREVYSSAGKKLISGVLNCLPPALQSGSWLDSFSKVSRSKVSWKQTTVINSGIFSGLVLVVSLTLADQDTDPGYLKFNFKIISDGEALPFWVGEIQIDFLVKPIDSSITKGIDHFNQRWSSEINKILSAEKKNFSVRNSLVQQFGKYAAPQSAIVKDLDGSDFSRF